MHRVASVLLIGTYFAFGGFASATFENQSGHPQPKAYPLWAFDEIGRTCRDKGRLQDRDYCRSHLMDQIVSDGKAAIPVLISQLRDTRPTSEPIYDYWSRTTAGDVAYFILNDLFTDSDWKTFNMTGLESLNDKCNSYAEDCWQIFLKKHGRTFVQEQWLAAWKKNKDRVYWNEERSFKNNGLRPGKKTKTAFIGTKRPAVSACIHSLRSTRGTAIRETTAAPRPRPDVRHLRRRH